MTRKTYNELCGESNRWQIHVLIDKAKIWRLALVAMTFFTAAVPALLILAVSLLARLIAKV